MKVFILGYNAADYFDSWFKVNNYKDVDFYFVDNGQQTLPKEVKNLHFYTTERNIGCGGGWNLICDIAFNQIGLNKVVIGEEDALFNQEMIESLWNYCEPNRLMTTYGNGFGFALYCMHKDTFNTVGRFDENFLFAGAEDEDYKIRCAKKGVEVFCMEVDTSLNGHATAYAPNSPRPSVESHNLQYLRMKWGAPFHTNSIYYDTPFNNNPPFKFDPLLESHYGKLEKFPSQSEYERFCTVN